MTRHSPPHTPAEAHRVGEDHVGSHAGRTITLARFDGRGRGVVALRTLVAGELIERAPVIVLTPSERARIEGTLLARYYFEWGEDDASAAIALGYGSLYNHSYRPNASYEFREDGFTIDFFALRDIAAGEEIVINYNNLGEAAHEPIDFGGSTLAGNE